MRRMLVAGGLLAMTLDVAHADFEIVTPAPAGSNLNGVWGSGKDVYVVGDVGLILKTSDDGKTWKRLASKTTAALRGIWGSGPSDIYVVGDGNRVLHSTDAGATWATANPPTGVTTALMAAWGTSADDVFVAGVNGALAHTSDRGKTWTSLNRDGKLGYKTLYGVAGTTKAADMFAVGEGGATWQRSKGTWLGGGGGGTGLRAIAPMGTEYLTAGEAGRISVLDATGHAREVAPTTSRILRGAFARPGVAVVVGETEWSKAVNGTRGVVLRSTDNAKTWTPVDGAADHHLSAVWGDARAWWIVGEAGVISRSTDGGATWRSLQQRAFAASELTAFASDGKVIVASSQHGLARSTDTGKTWTSIGTGFAARVARGPAGFIALGNTIGPMAIARSTDGATWTAGGSLAQTYVQVNGFAAAGSTLIALGETGAVMRSTDGGAVWSRTTAGKTALRTAWLAGTTWWIAGDDEALFRSTDGGATWSPVKGPGKRLHLRAGWATGQTIVIAAVDSPRSGGGRGDQAPPRGVVVRSTDGGATWTTADFPNHYQLGAIAAAGSTLVIARDHGGALQSTDLGKTWQPLAVPTTDITNAAWTDGKTILIGGAHGQIWRAP